MSGDLGAVGAALAAALGRPVAPRPASRVGGGSTHAAYRWPTAAAPLLVKLAPRGDEPLLAAEADGLAVLAAARVLRVPAVVGHGAAGEHAWLALEWLELGAADPAADAALGVALAALHRVVGPRYGFASDNYIGRTRQPNAWHDDWPAFVAAARLGPQFELAAARGRGGALAERGARLLELVGAFYRDYRPLPSLLHGDLWHGNRARLAGGAPVVFDPAPYYGDREADLAMARLFGGFDARFHAAYEHAWPLDAGAGARVALHQLYHVLNHLNLFGGGYAREALALTERLLAAVRG